MRIGLLVVCLTWMWCGIGYADEAITFGNEDVQKTRGIYKSERIKADTKKPKSSKVSGEKDKGLKGAAKPKVEKEEKIVDSFVVLTGNRKYHLPTCKLVTKSPGKRSALSGAVVISGRFIACGLCKPKAYKNAAKAKAAAKKRTAAREALKKSEVAKKKALEKDAAKKKLKEEKKKVPEKATVVVPKSINTESGK